MGRDLQGGAPLPRPGDTLALHWMQGARVFTADARVAEVAEASVRLLLDDQDAAAALPEARRVAIVYRVGGVDCQARGRPSAADGAVWLELLAPPRRRNDRDFPRVTARIEVMAQLSRSGVRGRGLTPVPSGDAYLRRVSLSASGVVVELPFKVREHDLVDLLLTLRPGELPLTVQGEVVRLTRDGAALRFDHPSPPAQAALAAFVQARYLDALGADEG